MFAKYEEILPKETIIRLPQFHRDVVVKLPEEAEILGKSLLTDIQGWISKNENIICWQGHPEYDAFVLETLLFATKEKLGNLTEDGLRRAKNETDSSTFARVVIKWLKSKLKN